MEEVGSSGFLREQSRSNVYVNRTTLYGYTYYLNSFECGLLSFIC